MTNLQKTAERTRVETFLFDKKYFPLCRWIQLLSIFLFYKPHLFNIIQYLHKLNFNFLGQKFSHKNKEINQLI